MKQISLTKINLLKRMKMKKLALYLIIAVGVVLISLDIYIINLLKDVHELEEQVVMENKTDSVTMIWRFDHLLLTEDNVKKEIIAQGLDYPDIVLAQAIIETGGFTSQSCRKDNNLFGLRGQDGYLKFNSWTESVAKYKDGAQAYKNKPKTEEDYYRHLESMGYAENPLYCKIIKETVEKRRK